MKIWAIADLHLPFGQPEKHMEVFGPQWKDYTEKIKNHWEELISPEDLVLVAGDISWAMHMEDALKDLQWIDALAGQKVIIKGNHDYWWSSAKKLRESLPPSIAFIQNDVFNWNEVSIGGARLWDSEEYSFEEYIEFQENPRETEKKEMSKKIFERELNRLNLSLEKLDPHARTRIAMTHYPPIGADLKPSRASSILEQFKIDHCVFGHLHNVKENALPFGEARGVHYHFTSCDYLNFTPVEIQRLTSM